MSEFPWFASYPQGVPHEIDPDVYPNLCAVLDESAKKFPNHVGYTNLGADATYAQMKGYAESFAAYLQSLPDMKPGDRVALMMPNLLQYVAAVFGILKAGMVVVNINPLYTPREVNHTLKDSGAKAIVVIENFARTVQNAAISSRPVQATCFLSPRAGSSISSSAELKRWCRNIRSPTQ